MSYQFYKWLHLSSLLIAVLSTGLLLSSAYTNNLPDKVRKRWTMAHGFLVFLVLLAGFGMLARLKIPGAFQTGWLWIKLLVWLGLGMLPLIVKRGSSAIKHKSLIVYSLLLTLTVYIVLKKPF